MNRELTDDKVKWPLLACVILNGVVLLIDLICISGQQTVYEAMGPGRGMNFTNIFPFSDVLYSFLSLLLSGGFFFALSGYRGFNRRAVALIFVFANCVLMMGNMGIGLIMNRFSALKGEEYLVSYSLLHSAINMLGSPVTMVANALFFFSAGRYGIIPPSPKYD